MIVAIEDLISHETVEVDEVADHSGLSADLSADCDFDRVVVAVSVRIIALAIRGAVFGLRHLVAMQAVRGGEHVAAGKVGLHGSRLMLLRRSRRRGRAFRRRARDEAARLLVWGQDAARWRWRGFRWSESGRRIPPLLYLGIDGRGHRALPCS